MPSTSGGCLGTGECRNGEEWDRRGVTEQSGHKPGDKSSLSPGTARLNSGPHKEKSLRGSVELLGTF